MRGRTVPAAVLVAVAAALSGCGGDKQHQQQQQGGLGGTSTPAARSAATAEASSLEATQIEVVDRVSPTVVQIRTSSGLGSGVVYDDNATPSTDALAAIVAQLEPGRRVPVEVISGNGQKRTPQVTLGTPTR